MTPRSIRRAIERKAEKQARKEEAARAITAGTAGASFAVPLEEDEPVAAAALEAASGTRTVSDAQREANRCNAALSTGPVTPEGKARSARNALKTGLTGKTVLLASDDAALYTRHVQSFFEELQPRGDRETELVQSIADSKWRLARIPSLEFGIYALGRTQFAEEFQHLSGPEAAALIEARTYLAYGRQFNNLSIQESRLRRQCDKDTAELRRLQTLRAEAERAARKTVPPAKFAVSLAADDGFEFAAVASAGSDGRVAPGSPVLPLFEAA